MADNVTLPGTGALVATDEITRTAIVQHAQLFKLIFGGDGVYNGMLDIGQQAMAASIPVVLASNQSVIPVSQSGAWNIGSVTSITNPVAVTGTFWQATQPISGTVTANAGTNLNTSLLALETGGNLATIAGKDFATQTTLSALNTKVTACNTGAVVVASGTITTITNPVAVTGTFWQATQPVSGTVSATVSGTVTANLGTIAGAATEATLSTLNGKVTACNTGAVTISAALPAGANVIGKVSIDQTTPGTTNLVAAGQSGTWNITNISGTVSLPTGAATSAKQDTQNANLSIIADGFYVANAAFNKNAVAIGGMLDDVATTAATENSVMPIRITPQRASHANLRNQAGTEIGTATDPIRTDPTGTTTQPVSGTVSATVTPAALTAAAPTAASVGITSAQILASATYKRIELCNTSANTISIGIGSAAVLNSGMTLIGPGSSATIDGPITAAINAIASVAASNLAIQSFT